MVPGAGHAEPLADLSRLEPTAVVPPIGPVGHLVELTKGGALSLRYVPDRVAEARLCPARGEQQANSEGNPDWTHLHFISPRLRPGRPAGMIVEGYGPATRASPRSNSGNDPPGATSACEYKPRPGGSTDSIRRDSAYQLARVTLAFDGAGRFPKRQGWIQLLAGSEVV